MIGQFGGIQLIQDKNLLEYETVNRTWKERLFTFPWRPFVKVKTISKPSRVIYKLGNYAIMCHPIMAQEILRGINEHTA